MAATEDNKNIPLVNMLSRNPDYVHSLDPSHEPRSSDNEDQSFDSRTDSSTTPASKYNPNEAPPSSTLHRSFYALSVVVLYSALALASWIIIVFLVFRPTPGKTYGPWKGDEYPSIVEVPPNYATSERWFRAARVLQSIVNVMAIPVASAACASAAVIFAQVGKESHDMSLRQLMALADRSWTNPTMLARLGTPRGWRHYGSWFLALAILTNLVGAVVGPLQQVFLTSEVVKVPNNLEILPYLFDLTDPFIYARNYKNNTVEIATRNALRAASISQPQSQLWLGEGEIPCEQSDDPSVDPDCSGNVVTFGNLSALPHPFLAQVPRGFSTGLFRQFVPRINSTARVSEASFPPNCGDEPGSLFLHHENNSTQSGPYPWSVTLCIPADVSLTPWKLTRDRQDFSEEVYFEIKAKEQGSRAATFAFKVVLDTTAGYFELPNYMNNETAGPLLEHGPQRGEIKDYWEQSMFAPDGFEDWSVGWSEYVTSTKGPLQNVALALFGPDSFLATWGPLFDGLWVDNPFNSTGYFPTCIDFHPMGELVVVSGFHDVGPCALWWDAFRNTSARAVERGINNALLYFIESETLENSFSAAAVLANQAWMEESTGRERGSLLVYHDAGMDIQIPHISLAGIILISIFLAMFLGALLAFATYGALSPRWTAQLDSFAMLRIGGTVSTKVPLLLGNKDEVKVLDEIPGAMGELPSEERGRRRIGLGGPGELVPGRRYLSYSHEPSHRISLPKKGASRSREATTTTVAESDGLITSRAREDGLGV
ncbi:hypothetical protein FQN53_000219 [Emmonsiellopsis sp. PD_33]|nr:hypothetical protein FQN53_000219 [Emmonsiellopsis sp. PD_33]